MGWHLCSQLKGVLATSFDPFHLAQLEDLKQKPILGMSRLSFERPNGDMASAGGFSNAGAHPSRLQPRQRHARLACAPRVTEGVLGVGHSQGHTTLETIHHSTDPEILVAWIHLGYIAI